MSTKKTPEVIVLDSSDEDEETKSVTPQASKKRPRTKDTDEDEDTGRKRLHPQPQPVLMDDNCVVTEGLMELLQQIPFIRCGYQNSMLHIQQTDKWSCGFRNMQMIISSLWPLQNHSFWQITRHTCHTIPSVLELQHHMEDAWKDGFDADGAAHYDHQMVGKTEWIGAVEVAHLFVYMGMDATVVQFIRCPESRQQLVPFCVAYFQQPPPTNSLSLPLVQELLLGTTDPGNPTSSSDTWYDRPPLYLQWKGHSVCVVGYEVDQTNNNNNDKVHLLALDPMKRGSVLQKALRNQQVKPLRLDQSKLERQDCQIVVCSSRPVPKSVRERKWLQTATAAERAVLQAMNT